MLEEDETKEIPFHIPPKFLKHFKNPAKRPNHNIQNASNEN